MAAPRRVRLQIDERRAQLLELGIRLFSTHAYDDISIDDVADAAGISKGLLYHYFQGKREFYVEVIREASLQLRRLTEPDPTLPPSARTPPPPACAPPSTPTSTTSRSTAPSTPPFTGAGWPSPGRSASSSRSTGRWSSRTSCATSRSASRASSSGRPCAPGSR